MDDGASVILSMIGFAAVVIASVNDPNSAVAARTAVAIAMPLVIALVVLPTASSSVRIAAPSASTSPDISAMPWALSETGPKVSIATMTPTVVSRPQPASATANSERSPTATDEEGTEHRGRRSRARCRRRTRSRPRDPKGSRSPAPVSEVVPTSLTGRCSVPVKYPVSAKMMAASTMPIMTATKANSARVALGLLAPRPSACSISEPPGPACLRPENDVGSRRTLRRPIAEAETPAEM